MQRKKMNGIEIQISWATINQKNWKLWYNDKACNCEKSNWLHIKTLLLYITSGASCLQLYTQRHYITFVDLFFCSRRRKMPIFFFAAHEEYMTSTFHIYDNDISFGWHIFFSLAHIIRPFIWDCFVASRKSLAGRKEHEQFETLHGKIAFWRNCKLKIIEVINCCLLLAYFTPFSPLFNFEKTHITVWTDTLAIFCRIFVFFQLFSLFRSLICLKNEWAS